MGNQTLWQLSACEMARKIRDKEVSSVELIEANLNRIHSRNSVLNAVVYEMSDAAILVANKLDDHIKNSPPIGPLHGVPITIKDNTDMEGYPTTNGVPAFKDLIAPGDSAVVANLVNAGAVIIGRTNTPEFSFRATTDNPLYGRTFNPWNDWASAGGSSGGAAAAVMSGMGAIAQGNDIAGSLRYPAACTGAVTVKPGLGRVPTHNPSQVSERGILAQIASVQGVICREVRDVRLAMQSAIAPSALDPWHVPMPWEGPTLGKPIKVGLTKNDFGNGLDTQVSKAIDAAAEALVDAGYQVVEVDTPNMAAIAQEAFRTLFGETLLMAGDVIRQNASAEFNAYFDHCLEIAPPYCAEELIPAYARRAGYVREWQQLLQETPMVLTPFLLGQTFAHARDLEGKEGAAEMFAKGIYSISMNYLGLPAGNLPASYNNGLPIGIQIVGQRWREDMILDACEAIEDRVGTMAKLLFAKETTDAVRDNPA